MKFSSPYALLVLALIHYSHAAEKPTDVSSIAGVYSSAHPITVHGAKIDTTGYVEIDRLGRISAFELKGGGPESAGQGCYVLASGTATNTGLQGRTLTPGLSLKGAPVFQTIAGDSDVFGILAEQSANKDLRWFFHWGKQNSTVTIDGPRNVVNASNQASYAISGPALASPTPDQLRSMLCRVDLQTSTAPVLAQHMGDDKEVKSKSARLGRAWGDEPFDVQKATHTLREDNQAAMAIVDRLQSRTREVRIAAINEVLSRPDAAIPLVLYSLANALTDENRVKEAVFWYHVGKMRVMYDIRRNRDQSLGDVPQVLAMRLTKPVLEAVYVNDLEGAVDVVKSAIAWDNSHAHSYNPLWPAPHGLGIFKPGESGLAPETDWQAMNDAVHVQWLSAMSKIVADAKAKQSG